MSELIIEVGNVVSSIVHGVFDKETYKAFRHALGYRPEGWRYAIRSKAASVEAQCKAKKWDEESIKRAVARVKQWDGYISNVRYNAGHCGIYQKRKYTHFSTGLISTARKFFDRYNLSYQLIDVRDKCLLKDLELNVSDEMEERDYQIDAKDRACKAQRGIIKCATGGGKCLGKSTPVLMFNGSIKVVEDVLEGDLLMGPDSKPRKVLSTCSGLDEMYNIIPTRGMPYIVNKPHILSLKMTKGSRRDGEIVNISVENYLKQHNTFKHCAKGYRVPVNFNDRKVPLDPYFLGVWLGDGDSSGPTVTTKDTEIVDFLNDFAVCHNLKVVIRKSKDRCEQYAISRGCRGGRNNSNCVLDILRTINVIHNKHVPDDYKYNNRDVRLKVLAGLMDTDGSLHHEGYDFISKLEVLAEDTAYLARSLGLRAIVILCKKTCCNNGVVGDYYRVSISGDCSVIPVKISRKKAAVRKQKKDCLVFGFKLETLGSGEYYGFEIDGDGLFLLGDFTVTHNTAIAASIISELGVTPTVFYVTSVDLLKQAHDEISKFVHYHGVPIEVGMVGGGNKNIKDITVMTVQTAIRSLGEKYIKFDDEDKDDKTDISDIKADIHDLIRSSKCIIFDECQHVAAKTCQLIADYSENAFYRYGMSATPYRDLGDDIMIEACFGKPIVDISASFLIRRGYLVKPDIFFLNVDNMFNCPYSSYPKIYKYAIKENSLRNSWIAQIATKMISEGRLPLILCKHIDHGKLLKSMIPDSTFLHGSISKKKRLEHLNLMRERKCGVTLATSIFDEGIDVKPLDSLILAGSGKSATRALQRIGRILRPWPNRNNNQKKDAIAVDFMDHCKYLDEHSRKRLKIYKTEEEFNIQELKL